MYCLRKRRIKQNNDNRDLLSGLRGAEEEEENSLATILVRATPKEAAQFSQALSTGTNLTR